MLIEIAWILTLLSVCILPDLYICQLVVDIPFNADELDCPDSKSILFPVSMTQYIPWDIPYRAYLTIPPGLRVEASPIPGAGLGVVSYTFIPEHTWLGEYDGEILSPKKSNEISWYTWTAHRDGETTHYLDAHNIETSNFLRWINCARTPQEENVIVCECKGKIYYKTIRDILPGQELLVYYGASYAKELDIDSSKFDY
jgi:hypothetical protein